MKHIKSNEKEWLDKEGYSKKIYLNEKDLNCPGGLVQMIKVKPGKMAEMHYHKKQTEIFYFFDSKGYFIVNDERIDLSEGDVLVVAPDDRHTAGTTGEEEWTYIAFKYNYKEDDLYWEKK